MTRQQVSSVTSSHALYKRLDAVFVLVPVFSNHATETLHFATPY